MSLRYMDVNCFIKHKLKVDLFVIKCLEAKLAQKTCWGWSPRQLAWTTVWKHALLLVCSLKKLLFHCLTNLVRVDRICYINTMNSPWLSFSNTEDSKLPYSRHYLLQPPTHTVIKSHTINNIRSFARTFVSADFDVGKQPNLDDLPQKSQNQVRLPLL